MKILKFVFYIVWILILAVLQPTLGRGIEIFSIAPNMFLCFIIISALFRGKFEGGICGAVFGLVYDMLIGKLIGVNCLIYFYLGFGAGLLGEHFFSGTKRLSGMGTIFIGTLVAGVLYYIANLMVGMEIGFLTAVFRITLVEAVYNTIFGLILYFPIMGTMKLMRINKIF